MVGSLNLGLTLDEKQLRDLGMQEASLACFLLAGLGQPLEGRGSVSLGHTSSLCSSLA